MQYQPQKGDRKKPRDVAFADADVKKKPYRVGVEDEDVARLGPCPWKTGGYHGSRRYAINCLERKKDGSFEVKILQRGVSIFGEFTDWEEENAISNNEDGGNLCTALGGVDGHEVKIVAKYTPGKYGNVSYKVMVDNEPSPITDEEIAVLASAGKPTDEELASIYEENPDFRDYPEWMFYGYNLHKMFKPDLLTEEDAEDTDESELSIDDDEDDDEEEGVTVKKPVNKAEPKKAAIKPTAKKAGKPAPEPDEDADEDFEWEDEED
jgi:hypothetical protein